MNYKRGTIYFEITDKTKAVYTFQERSSGLKYFLSYYIQAKAIQQATRDQNCIILMDEPDSFLSITGQRNLLAVFESLVSADSSLRNAQLLYTTHSPFLINRNFPRRIRLVRKGDAEEGTQYVGACHVRRYEPIRSALGIDCAQTLFMGATNLIVEGTTDQYVISELVRYFATPDNIAELLDLNSIVLASADGAGGPEQLLSASTWGDEPRPATVVALDDDSAGHKSRDRITGVEKGAAQLILPEFVVLISEAVPHTAAELHTIVTIEDVFPIPIYAEAIRSYFKRWYDTDLDADFTTAISEGLFGKMGLVEDTQKVFDRILGDARSGYDKMGVLREAVALLGESKLEEETKSLRARFFGFCAVLREKIAASEHAQQIRSGKQAIKQLIREFFVIHKESSMLFDVGVLIGRLVSEAEQLGTDGTNLAQLLTEWREEIKKMRAADQKRLAGVAWTQWTQRFELLKRDPFNTAALRGDTQELSQVSSKTIVERESAISKQPVPLVGATPAADTQISK